MPELVLSIDQGLMIIGGKWDGEELGVGVTLSCPQTFVGNQLCNACKGAFSGIEMIKSGHRCSEARDRGVQSHQHVEKFVFGKSDASVLPPHLRYAGVWSQIQRRENLITLCLLPPFVFYS